MQDKKQKLDECLKNIREFFPETPDERIQYMKMYTECMETISNLFVEDYDYMQSIKKNARCNEFIIGEEYFSQVCNGYYKHIKELYSNKCVFCGFSIPSILEVNHVIPKHWGGRNDETNLIALCPTCHKMFHVVERSGKLDEEIKEELERSGALKPFLEYTKHILEWE